MRQQRSFDTSPEIAVRRALHRVGLRYRLHQPVVPGTRRRVDIAFRPSRVAVDVRGCYWHGHEHEFEAYERKINLSYWGPKIAGNRQRDRDTEARLIAAGWILVVVWECEDPEEAAAHIAAIVNQRRQ